MKRKTKLYLVASASLSALLAVVVFGLLRFMGISVTDFSANLNVGASLSAKLTCSGYHLSGMSKAAAEDEINSYAPVGWLTDVVLTADQRQVTATLMNTASKSATYRPGLGCTINNGDTSMLDSLRPPLLKPLDPELPWPAGNQPAINPAVQAHLQRMLTADNKDGRQTRALLVAYQGKLVAEAYAPGFSPGSQLLGWSMGKSLASIMLGHLHFRGELQLDEKDLFAAWRDDERRQITLENMLQMSSGLAFNEAYTAGGDVTHMLFTAPSTAAVAMASPLQDVPGRHFSYSSGTTNLLMQWLSNQLGGPQATLDFLGQHIYRPMHLAETTFEVDPSGLLVGSSYLYASGRDWARMGQLMLNRGTINGNRLLSEDWVTRASTPNSSSNYPQYGYHFWLNRGGAELRWPELPKDAYAMSGNRQQTVMIIPSRDMVLVRLGWTLGRYPMAENFAAVIAELP